MATRQLATSTVLRGASSRIMSSVVAVPVARRFSLCASFSRTTPTPRNHRSVRRISSTTPKNDVAPAGSKIWTFDAVQKAISLPDAKPKVTLIDTREPSELKETGRIPGAVNIPITSAPDSFHISADDFYDRFGFERPGNRGEEGEEEEEEYLVFYCKAGVRSRAAAEIARDAGFKNVGEFPGSWMEWSSKQGQVQR